MLSQMLVNIVINLVLLVGYVKADTKPTRYGYILYPGFNVLDTFGPIEALSELAYLYKMNLSLIAETMDPVSSYASPSWFHNPVNSTFSEYVLPTHTFKNAPPLDVLMVPGGVGAEGPSESLTAIVDFIRERYPTLQYLITVCNGAGLAARAGVLDGKRATTNKSVWAETIALGPKVKWIAQARWVTDGNIWTSSGVSAGIDVTIAFISAIYSEANATGVANGMEYVRHFNSTNDPFAPLYNLTDAFNSTNQN